MDSEVEAYARRRIEQARPAIVEALVLAEAGNPYAAEGDPERMRARLQRKAALTAKEANTVANTIVAAAAPAVVAEALGASPAGGDGLEDAELAWGDTLDFVNVAFLAKGARAARAVGRVAFRDGRPRGSGFLVAPGLFLTNHHVIGNPELAQNLVLELDYELDLRGLPRAISRFVFDASVFLTDPVSGLDYTLIGVGAQEAGAPASLDAFGWCGLSDAPDKHMLGEFANIVQHPQGRYKEVVLRENRLVSRLDDALHYVADTEPGSSGSPVFNSEWEVIALHHWGGPWIQKTGLDGRPLTREVNEGVRVSSIVRKIRSQLASLDSAARERVARALDLGAQEYVAPDAAASSAPQAQSAGQARIDAQGKVTWTIPLELSVHLPMLAQPPVAAPAAAAAVRPPPPPPAVAEAARPSTNYRDRSGYKPGFLTGHRVDLPALSPALLTQAAPNRQAQPGEHPHELKYHHFSVVMNRVRRLAFFTACNIDGAEAKWVKRGTSIVQPLTPDQAGMERLDDAGAEASESWFDDDRLLPTDYAGKEIYEGQKVPGFPNPQSRGRIARMFQRGHLVRRLDPVWGTDAQALEAELDTFHWTNCSPQVGFFNQGTADRNLAGTGGGKLWRAVENYVLRNAVAEDQRVTSFTGPIFSDEDRLFRAIKAPGRFFKIACWVEGGALRAIAMICDQRPVLTTWPEALWEERLEGAEAFLDPAELEKVQDFLSTVAEIEALTGLDFGEAVRAADVRAGQESAPISSFDELRRDRPRPRSRSRRTGEAAVVDDL